MVSLIVKKKNLPFLNDTTVKRQIVNILLNATDHHIGIEPVFLNVCATLSHLNIPKDLVIIAFGLLLFTIIDVEIYPYLYLNKINISFFH